MRLSLGEHPALDREPLIGSTSQDREAKYSPDGTKIAFISTRSGQPAVWRADRDGSNQILIGAVDQGLPGAPRWTSDGQSVLFDASSAGTGSDVYVVGAEGGTPRRLTSGKGHEVRPSPSLDGQWLYYSSENQVWKVAIKGGDAGQGRFWRNETERESRRAMAVLLEGQRRLAYPYDGRPGGALPPGPHGKQLGAQR